MCTLLIIVLISVKDDGAVEVFQKMVYLIQKDVSE